MRVTRDERQEWWYAIYFAVGFGVGKGSWRLGLLALALALGLAVLSALVRHLSERSAQRSLAGRPWFLLLTLLGLPLKMLELFSLSDTGDSK